MTAPGRRSAVPGTPNAPRGPGPSGPDQHAEEVLEQALRAMAGGGRQSRPPQPGPGRPAPVPFTGLQIVLLAILLGLLVGMTAGVLSLLT